MRKIRGDVVPLPGNVFSLKLILISLITAPPDISKENFACLRLNRNVIKNHHYDKDENTDQIFTKSKSEDGEASA